MGILDYARNPSFAPMVLDGSTPQLPQQGGGILSGWFQDDPGAASNGNDGRAPLTGAQKRSLLFSGISDAFDSLQGRGGNLTEQMSQQYANNYTAQKAAQRRDAVNKAIQDAYASGDMNKVRSALLSADPEDVSHITQALQFGQPKIQDVGGAGYTQDPFSGKTTQVIAPKVTPPPIRSYQSGDQTISEQWDPVSQTYVRIGAGPKFAPRASKAAAPGGGFGNPASLFGGN